MVIPNLAAFAAEESDEPGQQVPATATSAPVPIRRAALAKQALSHLAQTQRPASAPLPERFHVNQYEDNSPGPSRPSTTTTTPNHDSPIPSHPWQPTPIHLASASSSPTTSASSSVPRPPIFHTSSHLRKHHSPIRSSHRVDNATAGHPPSSTFSPSLPQLPTAGVPFVTTTTGPNVPIGSKRTLVDFEMADDTPGHPTNPRSTPSRAAKRRSMGGNLGKDEGADGDKDKDRRRGRRGQGAGPGSGVM